MFFRQAMAFCALFMLMKPVLPQTYFPKECKILEQTGYALHLKSAKQALFLIQNISSGELWLTVSGFREAVLPSHLNKGHLLAVMIGEDDEPDIYCIESRRGHEQQVPCFGYVKLCQWSGMTTPNKTKSSFWVFENLPEATLITALSSEGLIQ